MAILLALFDGLFCVQLFLFLNDLAGRWPLLDSAARLFYVSAVPLLATLLGAQMLVLPRAWSGASRSKVALATLLSLALGALFVWGLNQIALTWHLGNLSPRPWMTRRVNWLVVEPQDNSFPSIETLFAFTLASASIALNRKVGAAAVVLAFLLALTRLFCGNNYLADVAVAALLGVGAFCLSLALCQRAVPLRARAWGLGTGVALILGTTAGLYALAMATPRFASKLAFSPARAARSDAPVQNSVARGVPTQFGEGEESGSGSEGEGLAEQVALSKRATLFLPRQEAYFRGKLTPLTHPLPLLDVEIAPVRAGTTSYRCAAIRFEVTTETPHARWLVSQVAAKLTRAAFALDSQLQNVDVVCIARDGGRNLDASAMVFPGDEVPVFSASVQRKNFVLPSPALNDQHLDGGAWLRARSRLYINARVLPDLPPPPMPTPVHQTTPTATPQPTPAPSARPTIHPPVVKPAPTHHPTPAPTQRFVPPARPTTTPRPTSTARPTLPPRPASSAKPRPRSTPLAKATPFLRTHPTSHATPHASSIPIQP